MICPPGKPLSIEMVGDPDDLGSGIALNSAIFNLGRAFGPVLAGLLDRVVGLWRCVSRQRCYRFWPSLPDLLLMRLPPTPKQANQPKMKAHLKEGLSYVWHRSHADGA